MRRALLVFLVGCKPDLGTPSSLVTEPRVLAISSEPAELAPGKEVALTALVASSEGSLAPDVAWGFCADPAPLSNDNVVGDDCVYAAASLMVRGTQVTATIPIDACSVFGPTPPAPQPGMPARRPHDPDVTGGYYQPIRALAKLDGEQVPAIGLTRITCDLPNAPLDVVQAYRASYTQNRNPTLVDVLAGDGSMPDTLPAHAKIPLRTQWSEDSAESFPVFDPATRTLVTQREAIRVSWFVSGGSLASERTGRTGDETETFADNTWTTPAPGDAHVWVVVRDTRGGVAYASYDVTITAR